MRDNATDDPQAPLVLGAPKEWSQWLKRHHDSSTGVWLRIAKKGAEVSSITYSEALDVALCFGWIDARSRSEGPLYWLKRFTPRSARSIWSKVNREKALGLISEHRMQPPGLREVQRAQADGRWEAAYDPASTSAMPEDLRTALDAYPIARANFAKLNSQNRYAVLFRLQTAKRADTRARRIATFVAMLNRGEKLHP